MIGKIVVFLLLIAAIVYDGTASLVLNRTLQRLSITDTEKTPTILEKTREKAGVKRINRLTERSRKWLDARDKNGKE